MWCGVPAQVGFALVMSASCLSGFRFTLTQVLLHGHHDSGEAGQGCGVLCLLLRARFRSSDMSLDFCRFGGKCMLECYPLSINSVGDLQFSGWCI